MHYLHGATVRPFFLHFYLRTYPRCITCGISRCFSFLLPISSVLLIRFYFQKSDFKRIGCQEIWRPTSHHLRNEMELLLGYSPEISYLPGFQIPTVGPLTR